MASSAIHTAAHGFRPVRLTLARELRALTKSDLAARIERTPSAITQFEGGHVRPDAHTLKSIALALGLPVEFFSADVSTALIPLDACHFRSLRSASQRQRRQLLAQAALLGDLVGLLEHEVEFPPERVSEASQVASVEDIETSATSVRRAWGLGLGPIPNLTKLLENKGVLVMRIERSIREVDAFSFWHRGRPCIFLIMEKQSSSRTRWDAGHELGHLVMHADAIPGSPEMERAANRFAGAFLLPREPFLSECPRRLNWPHFFELKARWGVSVAALVRRARDLGCLSEATYRRACIVLRQKGPREKGEPPMENPRLIAEALKVVRTDLPIESVASSLSLSAADLFDLLALSDEDRTLLSGTA